MRQVVANIAAWLLTEIIAAAIGIVLVILLVVIVETLT